MMYFNYNRNSLGEWWWNISFGNNEIVCHSEGLKNRQDCLDIIAKIQKEAPASKIRFRRLKERRAGRPSPKTAGLGRPLKRFEDTFRLSTAMKKALAAVPGPPMITMKPPIPKGVIKLTKKGRDKLTATTSTKRRTSITGRKRSTTRPK